MCAHGLGRPVCLRILLCIPRVPAEVLRTYLPCVPSVSGYISAPPGRVLPRVAFFVPQFSDWFVLFCRIDTHTHTTVLWHPHPCLCSMSAEVFIASHIYMPSSYPASGLFFYDVVMFHALFLNYPFVIIFIPRVYVF